MDAHGRLHMPGFVGETFEETGVLKDREALKPASVGNRKQRRAQASIDRRNQKPKPATEGETV